MSFIWFCGPGDYVKCRNYFCEKTSLSTSAWQSFDEAKDCLQFIKESKKKIYLIASGTRLKLIIEDIHSFDQLDSIYIYCNKVTNYESLKLNYEKIRGIHNDPIHLLDQMSQIRTESLSASVDLLTIDENHPELSCLFKNEIKSYSIPNIFWSPWETNSCTRALSIKGQSTIEIWLKGPISFENRLSLPKQWQGLRDNDLSTKSGIPNCIFVHASGFIGGNATYDGVLAMAQQSLQLANTN